MEINDTNIWCVIPVYNNASTVLSVVSECKKHINNILVVDDGCTDANITALLSNLSVTVIKHDKNRGKGQALKTAIKYLDAKNAIYMITIDADGQHYPDDIPKFIPAIKDNNYTLAIGCRNFNTDNIPGNSRFGRKFSNLWVRLETGLNLQDTQSGFRAYPVKYISKLKTISSSYNFEIEILAKAVWSGIIIKEVPVKVSYPPAKQRISHFRPFLDNFRLSLIHAYLVTLRILPIPQKKLIRTPETEIDYKILFHPIKLFKYLLKEHSTPGDLALAASVGTFLAIIPIIGFHSVAILYVAVRLRLNKIMALNIQHLFMPPITPIICVELGHYILHGQWFTNISFQTICVQLPERILEWLLGSLILAPIFAVIIGLLVYIISKCIKSFLH